MGSIRMHRRDWVLIVLGILLICLAGHLIHDLRPEHGFAQAGCCLALHSAIVLFTIGELTQVKLTEHPVVSHIQFSRMLLQSIPTPPPIAF
jgi:hypothetical protein